MMLTHDKGLFEILQQTLAEDENKWKCFEFLKPILIQSTMPPTIKIH